MTSSQDNRRKELILNCRFYDGNDECLYEEKLRAHEIDKSHLPPPECMRDEYTLLDEEVARLKSAITAWNYERCWVIKGGFYRDGIQEYIAYGNEDFCADDGTPISLKALLWNRYYYWGGDMSNQNSFRIWYRKYYASEPTNREKRAVQDKSELTADTLLHENFVSSDDRKI